MTATKRSIDFTNVKEGGNFSKKHMPVGDYLAKVTKVEDAMPKDKEDKTPMWLFTIQLKNTPSATYPYYCKLQENQLWKVRNLLVAAGISVPKKKVGVDPTKLVGKLIAVSLDDTEYQGKEQSEISAVFSPSDLDESVEVEDDDDVDEPDEDDEEETPAPAKKKKAAPVEDDDEEDEDEEPAPKKKKAPEPEEDEDDDEEEEEPAPKKKKTKKERRLEREAKAKAAAASSDDDEDDDEIDIEDLD